MANRGFAVCQYHFDPFDEEGSDILDDIERDYCSHTCKIKHMESLCGSVWEEDWFVYQTVKRVRERLKGKQEFFLESFDFVALPIGHNGFQRLVEQRNAVS